PARVDRRPDPLDGRDATVDVERDLAVLDDADAAGVHRASVSPCGRRRGSGDRSPARRHGGRLTTLPPRISLALALHNHQPVGNFRWVFAEVYDQAYGPMIDALDRHPGVRLSLHYTGPLLAWMAEERPDAIERLRGLVDRDQVEILGGGYY